MGCLCPETNEMLKSGHNFSELKTHNRTNEKLFKCVRHKGLKTFNVNIAKRNVMINLVLLDIQEYIQETTIPM